MPKLIYIKTSPREDRSHSSRVALQFVNTYRASHPQDSIEELNLWHMDLPPFDGDTINAKYAVMHQQSQTQGQQEAWDRVKAIFQQFAKADKYLFSVPMWNFGIPYRLKHYIDILTQPGLAFNVSPQGNYTGLVTGKPAALVYSSGGSYRPGTGGEGYDLQKPYLKLWLQFIGFKDIREIIVDGTLGDPAKAKQVEISSLKQPKRWPKPFSCENLVSCKNYIACLFFLFTLILQVPLVAKEQADYIVIGAGTAGAAIAKMLSDDNSISVLVLHNGKNLSQNPDIKYTKNAIFTLISTLFGPPLSQTGESIPQPNADDNELTWVMGLPEGGTSAVNAGAWARGTDQVYSQWEAIAGSEWSTTIIENLYKSLENYVGITPDPSTRGFGGPLNIRQVPISTPFFY